MAWLTTITVRPCRRKSSELLHALRLELHVAHGEDLVHEQDVGVDVDGDGEAEPHVHAGRVGLHRLVDELLDTGEREDRVELPVDLAAGQAEDRAVEVHVLPARQLRVEARTELQEGGHLAVDGDLAAVRLEDPAMHLSIVDFPDPFSPTSPNVCPAGTSKVTS